MQITNNYTILANSQRYYVRKEKQHADYSNVVTNSAAIQKYPFSMIPSAYNVTFGSDKQSRDLINAASNGRTDVVNAILIDPEVDVNYEYDCWTALRYACRNKHNDIVRILLKHPNIDVNAKSRSENWTALQISAINRNSEALNELLYIPGIDVNALNDLKQSALSIAVQQHHSDMIGKLLAHPKTNPNTFHEYGRTPFMMALNEKDNLDVINQFLNCPKVNYAIRTDEGTVLHFACDRVPKEENLPIIKQILKKPGLNIDEQNKKGETAMMIAAYYHWEDAINLLLLECPDIDLTLKSNEGYNAIDYARKSGISEVTLSKMIEKAKKQFVQKTAGVPQIRPRVLSERKIPVDLNQLSAEDNIWTEKEITEHFLQLVKERKYDEAASLLEKTPLIDFESDNKATVRKVAATDNPDFIEKVFEYKLLKQNPMREKYEAERKDFLENKLATLDYKGLIASNYVLNTKEGFDRLLNMAEFNPNQVVDDKSLFDRACEVDATGNLAKQILGKYDDVYTSNAKSLKNDEITSLINEYENGGKFGVRLAVIKAALQNPERREEVVNQLKEFVMSEDFKPEIADSVGNTALHVAMCAPSDIARGIIQKIIDKGGDVNAKNVAGQTPLMLAIKAMIVERDENDKSNLLANIKFLLDKGVNINDQDNHGQTAFYYVCCTVSSALMNLILSHKPDVFLEDLKGNRPHINLKTPEMKEIYRNYILR